MKPRRPIGQALARGHALLPPGGAYHEPDLPGVVPAEKLSDRELKRRLCDIGPAYCHRCYSTCAYGREYLRRQEVGA